MENSISKKIENDADAVAKRLLTGEVFLVQTDTVFGLICCADDERAARKIIDIKHRDHPAFGLFVSGLDMVKQYVEMDAEQAEVFNKVFPGHFTLIFKANISTYSNSTYRIILFIFKHFYQQFCISIYRIITTYSNTICRMF